jgi:geranylgeranyl pyrophosphate synthase/predicted secreted hydrolase
MWWLGYTRCVKNPQDWPVAGSIDLALHDPPHRSSATEWWYLNTHLVTADERRISLFAAFFRIVKGRDEKSQAPIYAHSVTWAISDADRKTYVAESRVDKSAPEMGLERIKKGRGSRDPRLNRAIRELLEDNRVPAPDKMFDGDVYVATDRLELDFAGARFRKLPDGNYQLDLGSANHKKGGCSLVFTPQKTPHRHGDDGVVRGLEGENMFYYFIPRCSVAGTVTVDGHAIPARGQGWYDHEFGGHRAEGEVNEKAEKEERIDMAWNWAAVQLDNGVDVTAYALQRVADGKVLHRWAVMSDASGRQQSFLDMQLTPGNEWRSKRTFYDYPVAWKLSIPSAKLELTLDAAFVDQEFITCISKPAFWEGRIDARGTYDGREVTGLGYVERSGFEPVKDLDEFFTAVGQEVRKSVASVLPMEPTPEEAVGLVACDERPHYLDGMDLSQLGRALIKPIREITDRGGKSWRSYAALACCDVVEGDSRKFVQWLAMPELLHVGSLIVDDVQDRSTVRRGGPAAHMVHGEPLAINAGTASYFLTQKLLHSDELSARQKLSLYDLYFECMRAGHAGQAIDLDGLHAALDVAAESGDAETLEKRVLNVHRLKAGVPAGCLARMGAVAGGGSDAQIEAVGRFFEELGLAFQIVDDVLNLRGFKGDLKSRGEDIMNGVVTLPVAKAMGRLDRDGRVKLATTLKGKPRALPVVSAVVEQLETSGAIQACADQASAIVESAWKKTEPLLPDTMPKIMLRAFGWYVLERHY